MSDDAGGPDPELARLMEQAFLDVPLHGSWGSRSSTSAVLGWRRWRSRFGNRPGRHRPAARRRHRGALRPRLRGGGHHRDDLRPHHDGPRHRRPPRALPRRRQGGDRAGRGAGREGGSHAHRRGGRREGRQRAPRREGRLLGVARALRTPLAATDPRRSKLGGRFSRKDCTPSFMSGRPKLSTISRRLSSSAGPSPAWSCSYTWRFMIAIDVGRAARGHVAHVVLGVGEHLVGGQRLVDQTHLGRLGAA